MMRLIRQRRVFADAARIGMLTAAAKAAGAAKTVVSAQYFGATDELDAYLIAFLLPSFLADVLAGGILPATMPVLLDLREKPEAETFYANVLYRSLQTLTVVAMVTALASPWILSVVASGFPPAKIALTRSLLLWMLPILPLSALANTWRTMLHAHERFVMAALAPVLTPLVTIAALLAVGAELGIATLARATVAGAALECAVLAFAVRSIGHAPFPAWPGRSTVLRPALRQYVPLVSANLLISCSTLVDQAFAATLGAGSVSALNLGTRVVSVMLAIGPAALGTASFPRLSRAAAAGDWFAWRGSLRLYAMAGLLVAVPLTALLIQFSEPIARMMFERGAFTSSDTRIVARVQSCAFLQLPFALVLSLLVKAVSSRKANRALMSMAAVSVAATIGLDFVLMREFGIAGIALASAGVQLIGMMALLLFLFFRVRKSQTEW
jgi:putative peptidoglycan lipid II flippase